jgi:hypothetical protein
MAKAKVDLTQQALAAVRAAYAEAGAQATPPGQTRSPSPFKVGGVVYESIPDLAARNPRALATLTLDQLLKSNPGMTAGSASARMAHRSRILKAAGL